MAKKITHTQACADRRADFTPFVCSTDGAVHREGQHFLLCLVAILTTKWEMHALWKSHELCVYPAVYCDSESHRSLRPWYKEFSPSAPTATWQLLFFS